jgi:hypothetical protein
VFRVVERLSSILSARYDWEGGLGWRDPPSFHFDRL